MGSVESVASAWRPIEPRAKDRITDLIDQARPLVGDESKRDQLEEVLDRIDELMAKAIAASERQRKELDEVETHQEGTASRVPRLVIAEHIVATDTAANAAAQETARTLATFRELASEWKDDTLADSSVTKIVTHPAYQRIIGLGAPAVPLILRELEHEPRQWFWALAAIAREDPAEGEETVEGAARKWLDWGRMRGYIA